MTTTTLPNERGIGQVEPLWCPRDVAEFLNVSQATLSRWGRENVGPPFVQVGGVYRYSPRDRPRVGPRAGDGSWLIRATIGCRRSA